MKFLRVGLLVVTISTIGFARGGMGGGGSHGGGGGGGYRGGSVGHRQRIRGSVDVATRLDTLADTPTVAADITDMATTATDMAVMATVSRWDSATVTVMVGRITRATMAATHITDTDTIPITAPPMLIQLSSYNYALL